MLEEEHSRQKQKLEVLGQLTVGIVHNFNNLLSGILPSIELALQESPPKTASRLEDAYEACIRAGELVHQLTRFAGRKDEDSARSCDPREAITHALNICRQTFDRTISIDFECEGDIPFIGISSNQLEQVILNLCLNARDALGPTITSPRLAIKVLHRKSLPPSVHLPSASGEHPSPSSMGFFEIVVEDNGIGMDEDTSRRCLEPFFTTKDLPRGTGIGLSSTLGIVQEHGGELMIDTAPEKGCRVSIYLPASKTLPAVPIVDEKQSPLAPLSHSLLVVDDETLVRQCIGRMLERAGCSVYFARCGEEAIQQFHEHRSDIDAVLLDLSMPDMRGEVVLRRILEIDPGMPVACLTGYSPRQIDEPGFAEIIAKPILYRDLVGAVRRLVEA